MSLPKRDKGIDLLLKRNIDYYAIQCKFRQNCDECIVWGVLGTFFGLSFGLSDKISGAYLVTNTYDLYNQVNISTKVMSVMEELIYIYYDSKDL